LLDCIPNLVETITSHSHGSTPEEKRAAVGSLRTALQDSVTMGFFDKARKAAVDADCVSALLRMVCDKEDVANTCWALQLIGASSDPADRCKQVGRCTQPAYASLVDLQEAHKENAGRCALVPSGRERRRERAGGLELLRLQGVVAGVSARHLRVHTRTRTHTRTHTHTHTHARTHARTRARARARQLSLLTRAKPQRAGHPRRKWSNDSVRRVRPSSRSRGSLKVLGNSVQLGHGSR
jgi:hypothetical protein